MANKRQVSLKYGFRSGLEEDTAEDLTALGIDTHTRKRSSSMRNPRGSQNTRQTFVFTTDQTGHRETKS